MRDMDYRGTCETGECGLLERTELPETADRSSARVTLGYSVYKANDIPCFLLVNTRIITGI